jgi:phosphate transport system permease protein
MSVLPRRKLTDGLATRGIRGALLLVLTFAGGMLGILMFKAFPLLRESSLASLLLSTAWHPWQGTFGLGAFILASVEVALIALAIATPLSLLGALYLSECAGKRLRNLLRLPIDVLAGVPSVVFGLFGVVAVVPSVAAFGRLCGVDTTGYSLLAGGVLLAIMIMPFILSLSVEVFLSLPAEARETALALGATRWETVRHVVLKRARAGLVAAVVLGFARAFGETIAVMMVVGNVARMPHSLFDPAYPLPALIANNYGELMSIPRFDSALFLAALVLMAVVGLFSLAAQVVLHRLGRG